MSLIDHKSGSARFRQGNGVLSVHTQDTHSMPRPSHVPYVGTWSNLNTWAYQDAVGDALCNIANIIPYGVLCFMPSYSSLDKMLERWKVRQAQ